MAASRVTATAVRAAPTAVLVGLAAWILLEGFGVPSAGAAELLAVLAGVAAALAVVDAWRPVAFLRRGVYALLITAYVAVHAAFLGIEVLPELVFLALVLVAAPLRFLADRFAPLYLLDLDAATRRRVDAALARSLLRVLVAAVLAVLLPLATADLGLAGTVPSTTIPTAVVLAGGLVAVVLLLALLPTLERRTA